jgi:hypothetical protein
MKKNTQKDTAGIGGELTIKKYRDGKLIWQSDPIKNKVVSSDGYGRNLLMRQLAGITTYPIEIDSFSVGDGTTAPSDSDTTLGNALVTAIPITDMSVANNILTVDVFIADANLADDTYAECGFFCNLRMFSRILISPAYTKTTGEDTLFSYTLTFTG